MALRPLALEVSPGTVNLTTGESEQLRQSGLEVRSEIGRGASGVVFLAHQALLDRDVALKHVQFDAASKKSSLARLEREVSALVSLEHPGVVRLMDVQWRESSIWFVMEYVDGPTLRTVLDMSPDGLDPSDALSVVEALARVLEYVSGRGIVHRDLKPANIFLTRDGRCKVGDFGIALFSSPDGHAADEAGPSSRLTAPGVVVGTPAYLSPEQVAGSSEITGASDLYALGVVAYELFVGRVPFTNRGNVLALLLAQQREPPPNPRSIRPDLTQEFEDALLAPLAKLPADRPSSPLAFWTILKAAADRAWPLWESRSDLRSLSERLAPTWSDRSNLAQIRHGESLAKTGTVEAEVAAPEPSPVHVAYRSSLPVQTEPEKPTSSGPAPSPSRRHGAGWRKWVLLVVVFVVALTAAFFIARAFSSRKSGVSDSAIFVEIPLSSLAGREESLPAPARR
jgi:serine/threonine protein kinase